MALIHVRSVPEGVLDALKKRASRNRRSLQQEVLDILEQAAFERPAPASGALRLNTVRVGGPSTWTRDEIYDEPER